MAFWKKKENDNSFASASQGLKENILGMSAFVEQTVDFAAKYGIRVGSRIDRDAPCKEQIEDGLRMLAETIQALELKEQTASDDQRREISALLKRVKVLRGEYSSLSAMMLKLEELGQNRRDR